MLICRRRLFASVPTSGTSRLQIEPFTNKGQQRCASKLAKEFVESDDDKKERIEWHSGLHDFLRQSTLAGLPPNERLPKRWLATTFSRSSGAGGQNVNKVNTKADVRLDLREAAALSGGGGVDRIAPMPKSVIEYVRRHSTYYVASTHELRVSASDSRSQSDNVRTANDRLQRHLLELLSRDIEGETSDEQRDKVKRMMDADRRRTRTSKEKRKDVKGGRRVSRADTAF